jgi:hypothetical protein
MRIARRGGLTLVEMLVAMAVTLIMMGSVVTIFGLVGDSISGSRATIEISERLRNARNRLQADLQGITVTMLPPRKPEDDEGYFEFVEGAATDAVPTATGAVTLSPVTNSNLQGYGLAGDTDDILRFTTRSSGEPFVGRAELTGDAIPETITSQTAEVAYYLAIAPNTPTIVNSQTGGTFQPLTLYRRVLLVAPQAAAYIPDTSTTRIYDFQQANDISVRVSGTTLVGNTLGDLTKRENRWRATAAFPFTIDSPTSSTTFAPLASRNFDFQQAPPGGGNPTPLLLNGATQPNHSGSAVTIDRTGEDVILTNVLSFDVRAWDSTAPIKYHDANSNTVMDQGELIVVPGDAGYTATAPTTGAQGAYVDLNYLPAIASNFSDPPPLISGLNTTPTYDTWSLHYEQDGATGVDQNSTVTGTDTGTNGLDDDADGVVDEPDEFDTQPPYPVPLRGIQIKIRVYEPDSRQVREVTVVQDFLPQ